MYCGNDDEETIGMERREKCVNVLSCHFSFGVVLAPADKASCFPSRSSGPIPSSKFLPETVTITGLIVAGQSLY